MTIKEFLDNGNSIQIDDLDEGTDCHDYKMFKEEYEYFIQKAHRDYGYDYDPDNPYVNPDYSAYDSNGNCLAKRLSKQELDELLKGLTPDFNNQAYKNTKTIY